LIGHLLDVPLAHLAQRNSRIYSRYADDLTFSTNLRRFPVGIGQPLDGYPHRWETGNELDPIVKRNGFTLNPSKTRMQYHDSPQEATGLVVNRRVNTRSDYKRTVRAMAHRLFLTGQFDILHIPPDPQSGLTAANPEGTLPQLHGMLGHIDNVERYNTELAQRSQAARPVVLQPPTSNAKLYRRFLTFKEFYATNSPIVVCEGKTDRVYLTCAIKSLAPRYPLLATVMPNGWVVSRIRIFNYQNKHTCRILNLTVGTDQLQKFIYYYKSETAKFKAPGNRYPVIFDSDDGATALFASAKAIANVTLTCNEKFVRLIGNLYLVPTPLGPGQLKSCIEDSFDQQTKGTVKDGKTFNPKSDADTAAHYGKHIFSQHVEQNARSINFAGFAEILDRLSAVVNSHGRAAGQKP
jgi:RNA-directed DNA polymerase